MEMDIAVSVGVRYLFIVDLGQPVVGRNCAGVAENKSADRICDGRVLLNAPVGYLDIAVNELLVVENGRFHVSDLLALLSVEDIRLCDIGVARLAEHRLDAVLNILNGDKSVLYLALEVRSDLERKQVDDCRMSLFVERIKSLRYSRGYLRYIKFGDRSVSFDYLVHHHASVFFIVSSYTHKLRCLLQL